MRRWIILLLLVLLPAQMSWAAVVDYCAHEQGAGADHFGHHDHASHGHASVSTESAKQADVEGSVSGDIDCGHCHGQATGMLKSIEGPALERITNLRPSAAHLPRSAHTAEQPERPQWAGLA